MMFQRLLAMLMSGLVGGKSMPGVFEISRKTPIREIIEDILLLAECSLEREWEGQVLYLPLK